jgi:hypothetical protein
MVALTWLKRGRLAANRDRQFMTGAHRAASRSERCRWSSSRSARCPSPGVLSVRNAECRGAFGPRSAVLARISVDPKRRGEPGWARPLNQVPRPRLHAARPRRSAPGFLTPLFCSSSGRRHLQRADSLSDPQLADLRQGARHPDCPRRRDDEGRDRPCHGRAIRRGPRPLAREANERAEVARQLREEFERMNEAYRQWQIDSAAIGARLRSYLPGTDLAADWVSYRRVAERFYALGQTAGRDGSAQRKSMRSSARYKDRGLRSDI